MDLAHSAGCLTAPSAHAKSKARVYTRTNFALAAAQTLGDPKVSAEELLGLLLFYVRIESELDVTVVVRG